MTSLIGRLLIASLFIVSGILKILRFPLTVAYFTKVGLPVPEAMAVIAIVIELGGGLVLAVGWRTRWVAWFLAGFVLIASVLGHPFWHDPAQLTHFLKNLAILGGLLYVAAFGPGPLSADKR